MYLEIIAPHDTKRRNTTRKKTAGRSRSQWWAADVRESEGRIEAVTGGTLLRFTPAGWRSETDYFLKCTTTWGELVFRLKSAAEGKPRGPLFSPTAGRIESEGCTLCSSVANGQRQTTNDTS